MNQATNLLVFAGVHWVLVSFGIILLGLIVFYETRRMGEGGITSHEVVSLMNSGEAVVLDLRGRDQFKKSHILNAQNFPQSTLKQQKNKLEKFKESSIVLVDSDGIQAKKALTILKEMSVENAKVLTGGMRAWLEEKLPVHKE